MQRECYKTGREGEEGEGDVEANSRGSWRV